MQTSSASKRLLHGQMSESFVTAMFLSLSGGLQDAYTYFFRGKVYANAQTGNIVLLSQHLFTGDFLTALHYLIPLVAFASGILAAELFREHFQSLKALHWRQMIVLAEILLLFSVGFFPQELNLPHLTQLPILRTAQEKVGKAMTANIVAVGAINALLGLVSQDVLREAVMLHVPKGTEALNARALEAGLALGSHKAAPAASSQTKKKKETAAS